MSEEQSRGSRNGFCIYTDTLFQGPVPTVSEAEGNEDKHVIYATELDAQREIADYAITRIQEFLDEQRDFDDAIIVQEYVVPVTVNIDGTFTDEDGKYFGPYVR
jgi:hypothetical protein